METDPVPKRHIILFLFKSQMMDKAQKHCNPGKITNINSREHTNMTEK
jgi:hypothetical protein